MTDEPNVPDTPEAAEDAKKKKDKKNRKGAPTAIAVILAILLVIIAVVGLVGFNIWRVLFNPTLVKDTLTDEVLSTELVPSTLEVFSEWRADQRVKNNEALSGVNEPDIVLLMSFLKAQDWKGIRNLLVTDDFVVHLISTSVDGLYLWIDSDDLWPHIIWEMDALKSRATGQEGEDAIMIAYEALPEATEEQIADFEHRLSQVPEGVEVLYNLCQFPDPWHEDQVNDYIDALKDTSDNIPSRFNFSEEFGGDTSDPATAPVQLKAQLRLVRTLALVSWIVALVLLALLLALKVRSKKSLGKYIGIPLLIIGVIGVIIALVVKPIIINMVTTSLLSTTSDFARVEIIGSLNRLTAIFFQPLLIQAAVIGGIGVILIIVMFIKRKKQEEAKVDADASEAVGADTGE